MMKIKHITIRSAQGFTIVELMISLAALAIILTMGTVIITQIGALYIKGVNAANLQNASRTIMADLTGSLQFTTDKVVRCSDASQMNCQAAVGPPTNLPAIKSICVGSTRYSYILNTESGTDSATGATTPHVLWRDTISAPTAIGSCPPIDFHHPALFPPPGTPSDAKTVGSGGFDMVPQHMRITKFQINNVLANSVDKGDYAIDLWMAYGDSDLVETNLGSGHSICNTDVGNQYCGVAELSTLVSRRLQ